MITTLQQADVYLTYEQQPSTCPITQAPLRHPLQNPVCGHVYDRKGVEQLILMRAQKARCVARVHVFVCVVVWCTCWQNGLRSGRLRWLAGVDVMFHNHPTDVLFTVVITTSHCNCHTSWQVVVMWRVVTTTMSIDLSFNKLIRSLIQFNSIICDQKPTLSPL